jgi:hypothetical protein
MIQEKPGEMRHAVRPHATKPGLGSRKHWQPSPPGLRLLTRALTLSLMTFSVACGPLGIGRPPATESPAPAGTIALPTEAPKPTIAVTIPPTQDIPQDDQAGQAEAMRVDNIVDNDLFPNATRYDIRASVTFNTDEGRARIDGQTRIRFTNPLDRPLEDLVLMLWPND